jgi:hypothetical protein
MPGKVFSTFAASDDHIAITLYSHGNPPIEEQPHPEPGRCLVGPSFAGRSNCSNDKPLLLDSEGNLVTVKLS